MALVSYDYGSGSEAEISDEDDQQAQDSKVILNNLPLESNEPKSGLFSKLPEAKSTLPASEETDHLEDFIPTVKTLKQKKKIQITIPSLSEFSDLDTDKPTAKWTKASPQGSGLLGILPPIQNAPKNTNTMFVPNAVKKKNIPVKVQPKKVPKPIEVKKRKNYESDSDTDGEDIPIPETFDDKMWEKVCGRKKTIKRPAKVEVVPPKPEEALIAPEPTYQPYEGLDNVAFKELVGTTKRPIGNIKLIDINEEEILPDRDIWMTKSLTDPELAPKKEAEEPVDPTRRKKHHITYLAQKAKANEDELKATWATSKNNRLMSRAKYGF
ncbi:hypothetical protein ABEB36_000977 [Hypothenemus hampei]|uniref:Proline-rich protein PRCC n=1 Tax=Hypothenemus hampei TaxID=57062 RepID=A0ABD1FFP3_HYPHA